MGKHPGPLGERVGRGVIVVLGMLGGLAALDAVLLFFFLLFVPVFVTPSNPYIGLVLFIVVPLTVVVGSALAWAGYSAFIEWPEEPPV